LVPAPYRSITYGFSLLQRLLVDNSGVTLVLLCAAYSQAFGLLCVFGVLTRAASALIDSLKSMVFLGWGCAQISEAVSGFIRSTRLVVLPLRLVRVNRAAKMCVSLK
jgi:hypothetical protein